MPKIFALSGSLRKKSYNTALLRAAAELAPEGTTLEQATIAGIPVYNADDEAAHGQPDAVRALKDRIIAADGLLLASPEYNNSIPGPFKNAIDWLSRPPADIPKIFGNRPVGLIGATPSRGGTRLSQTAWLPVLRTLGTRAYFGKQLYVAGAANVFDADGELVDPKVKELLAAYMAGFAEFVGS